MSQEERKDDFMSQRIVDQLESLWDRLDRAEQNLADHEAHIGAIKDEIDFIDPEADEPEAIDRAAEESAERRADPRNQRLRCCRRRTGIG